MPKKLKIILILLLSLLLIFMAFFGYFLFEAYGPYCMASKCMNDKVEGSSYCSLHTCVEKGCNSYSASWSAKYCLEHECADYSCEERRLDNSEYCEEHRCKVSSCSNGRDRYSESAYCEEHKCKNISCYEKRLENSEYCRKHATSQNYNDKINEKPKATTTTYPSSLTSEQKLVLWMDAENAVEAKLKSPSTAKFPSGLNANGVTFHYDDSTGMASIWGWVEAENSYGTIVKEEWLVDFKISSDGKKYQVTNVEFF